MDEFEQLESDLEWHYSQKLCDATAWFGHARALIGSARITKERAELLIDRNEKRELLDVCTMLYGLAIENLFKAIWIYKEFGEPNAEDWKPDSIFPKTIKTHNLTKLASLVDKKLAKEHELHLNLLSEAAIWTGRYPCPIDGDATRFYTPDTHKVAEEIYAKYRKYFTISC